jgi:cell fate (sporulation/competence/biofilm development) regulator YlbF (YheA/YmcA/DUF963 family)
MSIDADQIERIESLEADELASAFGQAITDLPAYQRFAEAKDAVEANDTAQERITEFESLREEFMVARQTGQADEADLRELQEAQERLHDLDVMSEYLAAQSELELTLQELNEEISDHLVVDFGEKAGGCCED